MDDSNDPTPSSNWTGERWSGLPGSSLSDDTMFEALAHERRRYLLYTLLEDESWSLRRLARMLAAWENDAAEANVPEDEVDYVYASLYHAHVPKLVDLQILEFDCEAETITPGPHADRVLDVLESTGRIDAVRLEDHARSGDDD